MPVREDLHKLVDDLSDAQAEVLRRIARDLCESEIDNEPFSDEDIKAIRQGDTDIQAGRGITLEEYKKHRRHAARR